MAWARASRYAAIRRGARRGWAELAGGELAEVGDEVGKRGGILVERSQGFFFGGAELATAEASARAGEGELLEGLLHLAGQAPLLPARCLSSARRSSRFLAHAARHGCRRELGRFRKGCGNP